jgi:DNA ligase-1
VTAAAAVTNRRPEYDMMLRDVVQASRDVAETASRTAKINRLAALLRDAAPDDAATAVGWLIGQLPQGRIGLGPAAVRDALALAPPAADSSLTVRAVDDVFTRIAAVEGAGSARARVQLLAGLLAQADDAGQDFIAHLIWGELRQGALEGVMADAVARAADLPTSEVRRAAQYAGSLGDVVRAALSGGSDALRSFGIQLFRPLQPMLAQPAEDVPDALSRLHRAALDYKLDGARVQVHRRDDEVRVYTRRLNEITQSAPELVEVVRALPVREIVLDGEAIALRDDGRPEPFQVTMSRFGTRTDAARLKATRLSTFFFDLLQLDGESFIDTPAEARFAAMQDALPAPLIIPRIVTSDVADAERFMRCAKDAGHEGIVAKALDASYDAGRRGGAWLKVKQADTLDLVVLAAEWGSGRRQGWLSNLHLGARNPDDNSFVMLGKTFKGLTDALLEWQTRELLVREIGREGHIVHVRPELVVEIAFEGVQTSTRYPGGVALRFARVRRYRSDKTAADADTIDRVRSFRS